MMANDNAMMDAPEAIREALNYDALVRNGVKGDVVRELAIIVMSEQTGSRSLMATAESAIKEILRLRALTPAPEKGEVLKPLPGELAMIQIALIALRHIASYSPVSRIQPVMIARDALKEIDSLTFESEPVAALVAGED